MSEENVKAESGDKSAPKKEEPAAPAPLQAAKPEAPQAAAQAPSPAPVQPAAAPKEEAKKKEKPANCAGCNKSIRKKRWYYRDGKYYCTKRCWKSQAASKKDKPPEGQA